MTRLQEAAWVVSNTILYKIDEVQHTISKGAYHILKDTDTKNFKSSMPYEIAETIVWYDMYESNPYAPQSLLQTIGVTDDR